MITPIEAWRRETVYVHADVRGNPDVTRFRLRRYRLRAITTVKGSWGSARLGDHADALVPVRRLADPADITAILVRPTAQAGVHTFQTAGQQPVELVVLDKELPQQRAFPLYSEVNSYDCLRAYCSRGLSDQCPVRPDALQGRVTRHAIQLARHFGIEPLKQAMHWFDDPSAEPALVDERIARPYDGYQALVLKGAIAAPIIWCGSISRLDASHEPNTHFLQVINTLAPAGSMAWCADEPSADGIGNGMAVTEAIARVRLVQRHAPRLIPMITTGTKVLTRLQALAPELPILYSIVQNEDHPDLLVNQKGSYFSCMAQGCGDSWPEKQRTTYPVAVVEGCPIADFEAAIRLAHANRARFALYYKITLRLTSCWVKGGLYANGGNGDGTAMYIDPGNGLTIPSIRMLHWHQAQQAIEKEMLG